jgi:dipeptidyl aminopeptidase/acylaminoacyl peptidase
MKRYIFIFITVVIVAIGGFIFYNRPFSVQKTIQNISTQNETNIQNPKLPISPLSIEYMRQQKYPGSDIVIEETLTPGSNYDRYIVSYKSDGLKIFALLTVPRRDPSASSGLSKPNTGWPVIIFNHGYIPPEQYATTERYIAYTDAFSRNGYILLRPDYRGNGNSEGKPEGAYYSPAYTIDVLNAVSSIKKYPGADSNRIGMWGHSMGGAVTLRSMVVTKDIRVGIIWAGVTASYSDLANNWHRNTPNNPPAFTPSQREQSAARPGRQQLINTYGTFETNPKFWESISPISYVKDVSGPIQIHHGTADEEVPLLFSQKLDETLKKADKNVEFYTYEGDNHNLSNNLNLALQRSVEFFDKYLKK